MIKATYKKIRLQFKQPSGTSRGILHYKDSWILKLYNEQNPQIYGLGECSIIEGLSPDNLELLPKKIAEVCENTTTFIKNYHSTLIDFPALRFAIETALKDLENGGHRILYSSPFTKGEKGIPINGLLWMGDYHFMEKQLIEKLAQGYNCIKMKVGAIETEKELDLLRKIRQLAPKITLRVDANGAYSPTNVMPLLEMYAELHIHSIEQPIKAGQWEEMALLCKKTPIPIALDEELIGISDFEEKKALLDTIRPQFIILKPSLLGGIDASQEWIQLAEERNIGWWITSALESNIGLNAISQWTATLNVTMQQGLGTGALYVNNFDSPLEIRGEELWYNTNKKWQCY